MKQEVSKRSSNDAIYALGMIGAAVHFIQAADSFWEGLLGLLKAFLWPAFMVYEAFGALLN